MEDIFGDHRLCCLRVSHIPRHKGIDIVDALARSIVTSGARVDKEVAINGRGRPADLRIQGWGQNEALNATRWQPLTQDRLARVFWDLLIWHYRAGNR